MSRLSDTLGSYRVRLILGYLLVVVLLAAVWAASLFGPLDAAVRKQQRDALATVARGVAGVVAAQGIPSGTQTRKLVDGTGWRVTIVAKDGKVLADSSTDPATMENHASRPEIAAALDGRVGTAERTSRTTGVAQLYVAVPSQVRGSEAAVRLSEPVMALADISGQTRGMSLFALIAALILAAIVAWRLATAATKPVAELADSARRMAAGDLAGAVPPAPGELGQLSSALTDLRDQMRDRVSGLESERRDLRAVLDGVGDAMFLVEGERVMLANDAASSMFEAPFGGWAGSELDDRVLPASLAAAIEGLVGVSGTSPPRQGHARDVGPDPKGRWYRATVRPLPRSPGTEGDRRLVIVADTTDRMRLDRMRTDFVANASHELKTPTAGILLLAESARSAAADDDTETAMAFLGQIENEADRLRRLVADLLDLSRLEGVPEPDTVTDLRRAVDLTSASHNASARMKGLGLAADFSSLEGEDVYVRADPTDIAVALDNLLDNAVTYTERGTVTVRVYADATWVTLAVADTGIGIPPDDLPRVFERFYRVDRSRARLTGGTGLGLSLVRHIAERSGGSVEIESEPGVGTTVTLVLARA